MARIPQRDQTAALLYHARSATPFTSKDGQPCASVPGQFGSRRVHAIRSASFRDWLTSNFYGEFEMAPAPPAFRTAIRLLEARARHTDFPSQKLDQRLGFEGDSYAPSKIILDLANPSGQVLEMDSHGWQVCDNMQHPFRQSITTLPLPRPLPPPKDQPDASLQVFDQFAHLFLLNASDRARILAWLMSALRPTGPYPILVLEGPAASGKSMLARALRALIDPSPALVRRLPDREDELLPYAFESWILAFEDPYRFSHKIADALSAISSGDALRVSQPDLRDELEFEVARPILLIARHDESQPAWTPPRSLSHRTVSLQRSAIRSMHPEREIWSEFESLRPALLAALAQAVVTALHRIREIDLVNVARFPDSAYWCAAAAPALGLKEEVIIDALTDPTAMWLGADPLRDALRALLAPDAVWTGDATTLLNQLRVVSPRAALPSTPKGLSQMLPGVLGFRVEYTRTKHARSLVITRLADLEQTAAAGHMNS